MVNLCAKNVTSFARKANLPQDRVKKTQPNLSVGRRGIETVNIGQISRSVRVSRAVLKHFLAVSKINLFAEPLKLIARLLSRMPMHTPSTVKM